MGRVLSYRIMQECGASSFAVYHVLLGHADTKRHTCEPSIRRIAQLVCLSPNTVRACLAKLQQSGFLIIRRRHEPGKAESDCHEYTLLKGGSKSEPRGSDFGMEVVQHLSEGGSKSEPEEEAKEEVPKKNPPDPQRGSDGD